MLFRNKTIHNYRKDDSPLVMLTINITAIICMDYIYSVCLDAMKRTVETRSKCNKNIRQNEENN